MYEDSVVGEPKSGGSAVEEAGMRGIWNSGANVFQMVVDAAEVAGIRVTALVVNGKDSPTALVDGGPTTSAGA